MLTAYDYAFAKIVDEAGIDMILVGDSLGMVFCGDDNTLGVTLEQMIYHTKAVKKVLLKTSPNYAKHHKKEAIKEVIRVKPNMPVYQEPLFAEMYVMPYVSDNGIYHDVQKVYIKVKNGEWVLNTKNKQKNEKIFNLE